MRRISIILIVSLALPCAAWAVCCTSIVAGPTAYAPEYSTTGCAGKWKKASYGGTANAHCDNTNLYMTTFIQGAKLYQAVPGANAAVVAQRAPFGTDFRCNATTSGVLWTTTPTCVILTGPSYFVQYTVTTTACPTAPAVTKTSTSDLVPST